MRKATFHCMATSKMLIRGRVVERSGSFYADVYSRRSGRLRGHAYIEPAPSAAQMQRWENHVKEECLARHNAADSG